ncbi:MAG: glycoside hydrolase family 13 protein [Clostridia bacterium]|nr:glycoside hydrolase family 13 protein [Clostridia bacterium]
MKKRGGTFEVSASFSVGLYWYCFDLHNGKYIGSDENLQGVITDAPVCFQLSVFSSDYRVPNWIKGGVIYQIFPDRFYRGGDALNDFDGKIIHKSVKEEPLFLPNGKGKVLNNDFYGGDLKGITEKLPYLKSLNVSAIYLNPIFKAYSNHRYDTGDFMQIDPMLGDENDLKNLIKAAKKQKINVILDGVFNHVGVDSVYFNKYGHYNSVGAYQSKDSPYYSWFDFSDYPDEYRSWWGVKILPALNKDNPSYIDYICGENGVLRHYLDFGVKGYRLDVVDELPHDFVTALRKSVKSKDKDAIIIGEVWEDASNKISYDKRREYFLGGELDSVMNYPLKNAIIGFVKTGDAMLLSRTVKTLIDHYPKNVLDALMNVLSTHDTARLLSALSDAETNGKSKSELANIVLTDTEKETAVFRLKAASLLQYTLFGVPSVYYGDEAGMEGFFDPMNRKYFVWDNINYDVLNWYTLLGKIRKENCVFRCGALKEVYCADGFYSFLRRNGKNALLIVVGVGNKKIDLNFKGKLINILDGKIYDGKISVENQFLGIFKKLD